MNDLLAVGEFQITKKIKVSTKKVETLYTLKYKINKNYFLIILARFDHFVVLNRYTFMFHLQKR